MTLHLAHLWHTTMASPLPCHGTAFPRFSICWTLRWEYSRKANHGWDPESDLSKYATALSFAMSVRCDGPRQVRDTLYLRNKSRIRSFGYPDDQIPTSELLTINSCYIRNAVVTPCAVPNDSWFHSLSRSCDESERASARKKLMRDVTSINYGTQQ